MTSINTLFGHIEDLTRINVNNILQDMITYGNSLNVTGETVTLKFKSSEAYDYGSDRLVNGLGVYLLSSINETPSSISDIPYYQLFSKDNYNFVNVLENEDYGFEVTFNNVTAGTYYVIMCDYENGGYPYPLDENATYSGSSDWAGSTNLITEFATSVSESNGATTLTDEDKGTTEVMEGVGAVCPISIVSEGTNTWYMDLIY